MLLLPSRFQDGLRPAWFAVLVLLLPVPAVAQDARQNAQQPAAETNGSAAPQGEQGGQKPPKPYGGGSPLDVLMHAKLWEQVPEAKPFVKDNRPPVDALQYQPTQDRELLTNGPVAPHPQILNGKELQSLQGELEHAGARNEKAAGKKSKNFADVSDPETKPHKAKHEKIRDEAPTQLHAHMQQ
jgi:hypothetical protein